MQLRIASRTRMRTDALLGEHLSHPNLNNTEAGVTRSPHPSVPVHRVAIGRSAIVPKESAYLIEIFGMSAGVLVMDGKRFVFRAVHRAFWELDESCFSSAAHAERAVHSSWTRFQHRSRPDIGR